MIEFREENETFNEVSPTPNMGQPGQYLSLVAHQPLRDCVHRVEDEQFRHPCKALRCQLRYMCQCAGIPEAPDPRTRAVPDSEPLDEGGGDIGELQVVVRVKSAVTWRSFSSATCSELAIGALLGTIRRSSNPRLASATTSPWFGGS